MTAIILRRRKLGRGSSRGIRAASTKGITEVRHWKDQLPAAVTTVFRWGCTAQVAMPGATFINSAESINWCSNKKEGRLAMQSAGVPVPETWAASAFYADHTQGLQEFDDSLRFVLRPARHAQGRQLYSGTAAEIAERIRNNASLRDGYVSELVAKVAEYRVFCVQNRVAWVAKKTPGNPDQVAWNVAQGGRFDNVRWEEWPKRVIQAALAAAKVSGTDFCGVDVMVDAAGAPFVLEVNSAPSQTSPYRQGCVAKAFDHIVENGKTPFDDVPDSPRRTYKSYIHPAVVARGEAASAQA